MQESLNRNADRGHACSDTDVGSIGRRRDASGTSAPSRIQTLSDSPGSEDQIPIHSLPTTLFNAEIAESDARYEVFGLSGEGTL